MDNIQELKKKHYNIKEVIKNHIRRKTDCKKQVEQYLKIINELRNAGVEVNDTSSYINQALKQYNIIKVSGDNSFNTQSDKIETSTIPQEPEKSIYKITLAWTERPGREPDNTVQIIENYFKENGAREVDRTSADFDEYKENMCSYEWNGDDKEFAILRKSANYILDVFAKNQYERFNISIFGNKKIH